MALPNGLQKILIQNGGAITNAQAKEIGISNERLRLLVKAGELERATLGIYVSPYEFVDKMYIAQLRRPRTICSHETALFLNDLIDYEPLKDTVTVPIGYSTVWLQDEGFIVFTIKRELYEIGITQFTTMFGNTVTAYDMERTICDCLRSRKQIDTAILTDAINRYAKLKDKDLNALIRMAEVFQVTKPLRNYMEVLL